MAKSRTTRANRKKFESFVNCLLFWFCCGRKLLVDDDDEDGKHPDLDTKTSNIVDKSASIETIRVPKKRRAPEAPKALSREERDIKDPDNDASRNKSDTSKAVDDNNNDVWSGAAPHAPGKRRAPLPPKTVTAAIDIKQTDNAVEKGNDVALKEKNDTDIGKEGPEIISSSDINLNVSEHKQNEQDKNGHTTKQRESDGYPKDMDPFGEEGVDADKDEIDDDDGTNLEVRSDDARGAIVEGTRRRTIDDYPEDLNPFADDDDDYDDDAAANW